MKTPGKISLTIRVLRGLDTLRAEAENHNPTYSSRESEDVSKAATWLKQQIDRRENKE